MSPESARPSGPERLFDPATREGVRRRTRPGALLVLCGAPLVFGGLVGGYHFEAPFLPFWLGICADDVAGYDCAYDPILDWLAGLSTAALTALLAAVLFRHRRIPPTVRCQGCGAHGWIVDLAATAGRCPVCGHDRFRYRGIGGAGVPAIRLWRRDDADGRELLAMRAANDRLQ